jgi:arylesterase/paraoxonase
MCFRSLCKMHSIHSLGDGKLLVTNDHYIGALISPFLSQVETFAGVPGGGVVYTDIHSLSHTKSLARVPFANGIAMLNPTIVAVATSSKAGVYFYRFDADIPSLRFRKYVRMPSAVDGLSVDSSSRVWASNLDQLKVLMAGHPFAPALVKVAKHRVNCDMEGANEQRKACHCTSPSWIAEWTEEGGMKTLYKDNGEEFCSSSTFARDVRRGFGIATGLYDRGLFVVKERRLD